MSATKNRFCLAMFAKTTFAIKTKMEGDDSQDLDKDFSQDSNQDLDPSFSTPVMSDDLDLILQAAAETGHTTEKALDIYQKHEGITNKNYQGDFSKTLAELWEPSSTNQDDNNHDENNDDFQHDGSSSLPVVSPAVSDFASPENVQSSSPDNDAAPLQETIPEPPKLSKTQRQNKKKREKKKLAAAEKAAAEAAAKKEEEEEQHEEEELLSAAPAEFDGTPSDSNFAAPAESDAMMSPDASEMQQDEQEKSTSQEVHGNHGERRPSPIAPRLAAFPDQQPGLGMGPENHDWIDALVDEFTNKKHLGLSPNREMKPAADDDVMVSSGVTSSLQVSSPPAGVSSGVMNGGESLSPPGPNDRENRNFDLERQLPKQMDLSGDLPEEDMSPPVGMHMMEEGKDIGDDHEGSDHVEMVDEEEQVVVGENDAHNENQQVVSLLESAIVLNSVEGEDEQQVLEDWKTVVEKLEFLNWNDAQVVGENDAQFVGETDAHVVGEIDAHVLESAVEAEEDEQQVLSEQDEDSLNNRRRAALEKLELFRTFENMQDNYYDFANLKDYVEHITQESGEDSVGDQNSNEHISADVQEEEILSNNQEEELQDELAFANIDEIPQDQQQQPIDPVLSPVSSAKKRINELHRHLVQVEGMNPNEAAKQAILRAQRESMNARGEGEALVESEEVGAEVESDDVPHQSPVESEEVGAEIESEVVAVRSPLSVESDDVPRSDAVVENDVVSQEVVPLQEDVPLIEQDLQDSPLYDESDILNDDGNVLNFNDVMASNDAEFEQLLTQNQDDFLKMLSQNNFHAVMQELEENFEKKKEQEEKKEMELAKAATTIQGAMRGKLARDQIKKEHDDVLRERKALLAEMQALASENYENALHDARLNHAQRMSLARKVAANAMLEVFSSTRAREFTERYDFPTILDRADERDTLVYRAIGFFQHKFGACAWCQDGVLHDPSFEYMFERVFPPVFFRSLLWGKLIGSVCAKQERIENQREDFREFMEDEEKTEAAMKRAHDLYSGMLTDNHNMMPSSEQEETMLKSAVLQTIKEYYCDENCVEENCVAPEVLTEIIDVVFPPSVLSEFDVRRRDQFDTITRPATIPTRYQHSMRRRTERRAALGADATQEDFDVQEEVRASTATKLNVVMVGPHGSGKSTILQGFKEGAQLLQERPPATENGKEVWEYNDIKMNEEDADESYDLKVTELTPVSDDLPLNEQDREVIASVQEASVFVIVLDSISSVHKAVAWMDEIQKYAMDTSEYYFLLSWRWGEAQAEGPSPLASLRPRWEARTDSEGRVYYLDHDTRETQWEHPAVPSEIEWIDQFVNIAARDGLLLLNTKFDMIDAYAPVNNLNRVFDTIFESAVAHQLSLPPPARGLLAGCKSGIQSCSSSWFGS